MQRTRLAAHWLQSAYRLGFAVVCAIYRPLLLVSLQAADPVQHKAEQTVVLPAEPDMCYCC